MNSNVSEASQLVCFEVAFNQAVKLQKDLTAYSEISYGADLVSS